MSNPAILDTIAARRQDLQEQLRAAEETIKARQQDAAAVAIDLDLNAAAASKRRERINAEIIAARQAAETLRMSLAALAERETQERERLARERFDVALQECAEAEQRLAALQQKHLALRAELLANAGQVNHETVGLIRRIDALVRDSRAHGWTDEPIPEAPSFQWRMAGVSVTPELLAAARVDAIVFGDPERGILGTNVLGD